MKSAKHCISDVQLRAFFSNSIGKSKRDEIEEHITTCDVCRRKLLETKLLKIGAEVLVKEEVGEHVDEMMLSAYVDGVSDKAEKAEVERHLISCDDCWDQFLALLSLRKTLEFSPLPQPEPEMVEAVSAIVARKGIDHLKEFFEKVVSNLKEFFPRRPAVRFVGAAVAVVLVVAVALSFFYLRTANKVPLRNIAAPNVKKINLLRPKTGEKIAESSIVFSWQLLPGISQYHFILLNDIGNKIFEEFTDRAHLKLDVSVLPTAQHSYFWRVEGFWHNGEKIESDLSYFVFLGQNQ